MSLLNVTHLMHSYWSCCSVFPWEHTHTHTDPLPMAGRGQSCSGLFLVFADLDWDGNPVVMLRINTAALDRPAERVLRNWISCLGLPSEVEYQSGHLKRKLLVEASARCGSGRGSQDYRPELIKIQKYPVHFFPMSFFLFISSDFWVYWYLDSARLFQYDWNESSQIIRLHYT